MDNLVQLGVLSGYEIMDMLAALIFAIIAVEVMNGFGLGWLVTTVAAALIGVVFDGAKKRRA